MSDAVSPRHYRFGGTQLISVTRHLTSNGGQAVQYIARATRTDGANKSSDAAGRLEDLLKARVFLDDEIALLRGDQVDYDPIREPRVFQTGADIPRDVYAIVDRDGDRWYWGHRALEAGRNDQIGRPIDASRFGPFTEVLS